MWLFRNLWWSMANFNAYRRLYRESSGRTVLYFIILVLVLGLPLKVKEAGKLLPEVLPTIEVIGRYAWNVGVSGGSIELKSPGPISFSDNGKTIKIEQMPDGKNPGKDKQQGQTVLNTGKLGWLNDPEHIRILVIIATMLGFLAVKTLVVLIAGLAILFLGMIKNLVLPYENCCRLSVYALTTPFIMEAIQRLMWPEFPLGLPLYSFVAFVYLWLAVGTLAEEARNKRAETVS